MRSKSYYLERQSGWIVLTLAILSGLSLVSAFRSAPQGDVRLYYFVGDSFIKGKLPYKDFEVAYPPFAIAVFILPRLSMQTLDASNSEVEADFQLEAATFDYQHKFGI